MKAKYVPAMTLLVTLVMGSVLPAYSQAAKETFLMGGVENNAEEPPPAYHGATPKDLKELGPEPKLNEHDVAPVAVAPTPVVVSQTMTQDLALPDDQIGYRQQGKGKSAGTKMVTQMIGLGSKLVPVALQLLQSGAAGSPAAAAAPLASAAPAATTVTAAATTTSAAATATKTLSPHLPYILHPNMLPYHPNTMLPLHPNMVPLNANLRPPTIPTHVLVNPAANIVSNPAANIVSNPAANIMSSPAANIMNVSAAKNLTTNLNSINVGAPALSPGLSVTSGF